MAKRTKRTDTTNTTKSAATTEPSEAEAEDAEFEKLLSDLAGVEDRITTAAKGLGLMKVALIIVGITVLAYLVLNFIF